ncbi:3'-5' exonuclease, partial [Limnobacter sp.]|uniref:3'-5' exonuclease n=1 Tax=Limnobacter sp. TaxID=2003368 RepID=UPI0039196C87
SKQEGGKTDPKTENRDIILTPRGGSKFNANPGSNLGANQQAAELVDEPYSGWWDFVRVFLKQVSIETLVSLSPDYESQDRLKEVVRDTKARISELLKLEPDLPKALERFSDDQVVRILTIHKSKGLEFDSVIIMAIENEIFFGNQDENRCAFFVGVSRAKKRLILTHANQRERPAGHTKRWNEQRTAQDEYLGYATPFTTKA